MTQAQGDIPEKIDRYEIIEAVGFGAMGAVYKAFDPLIKRPVAVKTLRLDVPPQSPDYKAFLERFTIEARTAGRLSHPNIVTLYDVGHTEGGLPWLAMEFVEGETVADLLGGAVRLRPELVIGLVSQIASALDYAHSEGVVHRDIKPSNVIVYGGEKVKVTDFGIAKLMDAEGTQSGLMMGTPSYMSPEQAMGEDLDGSTDIFSLGVVAFEMMSGQQPFPGNNVTSILYKLVHSDPVHPADLEVVGLLPDRWRQVFSRALAKDPVERYPTAADFVQELELCLGSWFGALEGETVIVNPTADSSALENASPDPGAETISVASGENAADADETLVAASPHGGDGPSAEETVRMPGASDEELTRTTELTLSGGGVPETAPLSPPPETDVVAVPPPAGEVERKLYVDADTDATLSGADETVLSPPVSTATIRRPIGLDKKVGAVALGGVVLLAAVAFWALRGGEAEVEPRSDPATIPPPSPIVVTEGTLGVSSEPEGARVLVNGEERGTTPLELEELPLGEYQLRLERSGFVAESLSFELTEEAPSASFDVALKPAPKPAPRPAFVRIESSPSGAQVHIDGAAVGTTPIDRMRVKAGERRVRIVRDGFLPWEDTIVARSGTTETVEAGLMRRPAPSPTEGVPSQPTPPSVAPGTIVKRGEPGVSNPKCIECPAVRYPDAARRAGMQGAVQVAFIIDENGYVLDPEVEQSAGEIFDRAVIEGIRNWRYEPATKNGVPVRIRWVQRFRFQQGR